MSKASDAAHRGWTKRRDREERMKKLSTLLKMYDSNISFEYVFEHWFRGRRPVFKIWKEGYYGSFGEVQTIEQLEDYIHTVVIGVPNV